MCTSSTQLHIFFHMHSRSSSHRDWSRCKYKLLSLFKLVVEGIQERNLGECGENGHSKEKVSRTFPETVMHIAHESLLSAYIKNSVPLQYVSYIVSVFRVCILSCISLRWEPRCIFHPSTHVHIRYVPLKLMPRFTIGGLGFCCKRISKRSYGRPKQSFRRSVSNAAHCFRYIQCSSEEAFHIFRIFSEEAFRFLGEALQFAVKLRHILVGGAFQILASILKTCTISFTCTFQTVAEQLIDAVDLSSAHNYSLLLLWASQANAVPVRAVVCSSLVPTQPGNEAVVCT